MNKPYIKNLIQNQISEKRDELNTTRQALSQATGIIPSLIYQYEKQMTQPSIKNLAKICIGLKIPPEELIFLDFTPVHKEIKRIT